MADDADALIEFAQGVEWEKHADDPEVIDLLKKIRERADEIGEEEEEDTDRRAKVVVVGDGAVGKTCLFITYATGKFPEEYVPTVFENYTHETKYKDEPFLLHMWDTAGQEDYDRLRPLSYPGTEVVVLCFSLVNESTFESIREKWNPEINAYIDGIPKILVGTKLDMREQRITDPSLTKYEEITTEEGKELAEEIGAAAYIETSPLTGANLQEVFERVIQAALDNRDESEEEQPAPREEKKKEKKEKSKKKEPHAKSSSSSSRKKSESKLEAAPEEKKEEKKEKKKKSSSKKSSSKKSSRHPDETSEERRERRRKRKEEKKEKTETKKEDKKEEKRKKKKDEEPEGEKKKKRKKRFGLF